MAEERAKPETTPVSLLERARANDAAAWCRLVALYQPLVIHWITREGLRTENAEDVAQEVFAAAAAGLKDFRHDRPGDTFRGWLRTITHHQVLLHGRRNRGRPQAQGGPGDWLNDVADPDASAPEADDAAEVSLLYHKALDQVRGEFEERTWQAFWRTVIDGRKPADLTEVLGMSAAAIRQAKSRVLRRLKQEMGELLE